MPAAIVDPASAEAGTVEAAIVPPSISAANPHATIFVENGFILLLLLQVMAVIRQPAWQFDLRSMNRE
jgi:hypothetical protein